MPGQDKKDLDKKVFEYYQEYVDRILKILERMFKEISADNNACK